MKIAAGDTPISWVGGKKRLRKQIADAMEAAAPGIFARAPRIVEPFCGSMAMTVELAARSPSASIVASDGEPRVIAMWQELARNPANFLREVLGDQSAYQTGELEERRAWFLDLRKSINEGAALPSSLFSLLQTGFNGIMRTNRKGGINVPPGFLTGKPYVDPDVILAFSEALQRWGAPICRDFFASLDDVTYGSIVYLDPPYVGTFKGYGSLSFFDDSLIPFVQRCLRLGASMVAMSNSRAPDGWLEEFPESIEVSLERSQIVNSNKAKRGKVREVLLIMKGKQ